MYLRRRRDEILLTIEHRSEPTPPAVTIRLTGPGDGPTHLEVVLPAAEDEPAPAPAALPLTGRILEVLEAGPLPRALLRERLSVKNERLGSALHELERDGQVIRSDLGWSLPRNRYSTDSVPRSPFPPPQG